MEDFSTRETAVKEESQLSHHLLQSMGLLNQVTWMPTMWRKRCLKDGTRPPSSQLSKLERFCLLANPKDPAAIILHLHSAVVIIYIYI